MTIWQNFVIVMQNLFTETHIYELKQENFNKELFVTYEENEAKQHLTA